MEQSRKRLKSGISHNIAYTDEARTSMADNIKCSGQVCSGRNSGDSLKRERREERREEKEGRIGSLCQISSTGTARGRLLDDTLFIHIAVSVTTTQNFSSHVLVRPRP